MIAAVTWPPLAADQAPASADGVTATFTVFARSDGTMQVAADGQALYTFAADSAAGDVKGQDLKAQDGGTWYAVSPAGTAIDED